MKLTIQIPISYISFDKDNRLDDSNRRFGSWQFEKNDLLACVKNQQTLNSVTYSTAVYSDFITDSLKSCNMFYKFLKNLECF